MYFLCFWSCQKVLIWTVDIWCLLGKLGHPIGSKKCMYNHWRGSRNIEDISSALCTRDTEWQGQNEEPFLILSTSVANAVGIFKSHNWKSIQFFKASMVLGRKQWRSGKLNPVPRSTSFPSDFCCEALVDVKANFGHFINQCCYGFFNGRFGFYMSFFVLFCCPGTHRDHFYVFILPFVLCCLYVGILAKQINVAIMVNRIFPEH